jgi:hypothetical protein
MKLTSILIVSSFLTASAFGVTPTPGVAKVNSAVKPAFRKDSAAASPLFRDQALVRGGAVPGWAAYNEALDKSPLTAKACTSLVGWALGDLLAQVGFVCPKHGTNFVGFRGFFLVFQLVSNHSTMLPNFPFSSTDLHQRRSFRHEAFHFSFRLWFPLPWVRTITSIQSSNLSIEC